MGKFNKMIEPGVAGSWRLRALAQDRQVAVVDKGTVALLTRKLARDAQRVHALGGGRKSDPGPPRRHVQVGVWRWHRAAKIRSGVGAACLLGGQPAQTLTARRV